MLCFVISKLAHLIAKLSTLSSVLLQWMNMLMLYNLDNTISRSVIMYTEVLRCVANKL